jgi:hypothetical protein
MAACAVMSVLCPEHATQRRSICDAGLRVFFGNGEDFKLREKRRNLKWLDGRALRLRK